MILNDYLLPLPTIVCYLKVGLEKTETVRQGWRMFSIDRY